MSKAFENIDLTVAQRKLISGLLRRYLPNTEVWAYGSRVKFTSRPNSDLDLVAFANSDQKAALANLKEAFGESNLPFRVDLFAWDDVPKQFHKNIKKERCILQRQESKTTMGSGWVRTTIGAVAEVIGGGTPASKIKEFWGGDIPWITPKDLSGYPFRRIKKGKRNITVLGLEKSSARVLPRNTVLVTCRAPIGYVALAENELTTNQGFQNLILEDNHDPNFFYYLIKHNVPKLESVSTGTIFKEISGKVMKQVSIDIPSLSQQRAIAHILGSLDDKIELNRRMSETLEAMAQTLFKSWFIDFDPVIDNALAAGNSIPDKLQARATLRACLGDARKPLPKDIQVFFPDGFEENSIPHGWEISEIGEEVVIFGGATPSTKSPSFWNGGNHHWATPKDLSELLSPVLTGTDRKITDAGIRKISSGLLPSGAVLLSSRAPIGYLAIAEVATAINQGFIAMVCKKRLSNVFVLFWCRAMLDYIKSLSGGTIFPEISKKIFRPIPVVVASSNILAAFDRIVQPWYNRIVENAVKTKVLVDIRDSLLPKLLSGKMDAKRVIGHIDKQCGCLGA